jgi:sugar phosphate permease
MIALWSPPSEKGLFVSSLYGSSLGITITWPLMAFIIEKYNWQSAFYVTSFISLTVSILWYKIVADSPSKHSNISKSERDYIEDSLELTITSKHKFPPFGEMLKSAPLIALLWLHFSDSWGIYFILTSAPMFMNQVLKYDLKSVGIISSLPYIVRMISAVLFGATGDFLRARKLMSPTTIRKTFCIFCE